MPYLEKRFNLFYAVLTVPVDVREALGTGRLVKSTETSDPVQAQVRAYSLVAQWQAQIKKARGQQVDPKQAFWDKMRQDYMDAPDGDEGGVVMDAIQEVAEKMPDKAEGSALFKYATGQARLLAPLVTAWRDQRTTSKKAVDQAHRDVLVMTARFLTLEALDPKSVKAWTETLMTQGTTSNSLDRILTSCRSFWRYLKEEDIVPIDVPDPFTGSFRLAVKRAVKTEVNRQPFTTLEVLRLYQGATDRGDIVLARLIKLGAYTGARIEELCQLTINDHVHDAEGLSAGLDALPDSLFIRVSKTKAGVRTIPVHPQIASLVAELVKEAGADGYLIPSTAAGQYAVRSDTLSKRFGRLKKSLGFGPDHVFHSIRKTVATLLEQAGVFEGVPCEPTRVVVPIWAER